MPIHIIPERTNLKRYTTTENDNYVGLSGEITANTSTCAIVYHDGAGNKVELARADGDNWTTDPLAGFASIADAKASAQGAAASAQGARVSAIAARQSAQGAAASAQAA